MLRVVVLGLLGLLGGAVQAESALRVGFSTFGVFYDQGLGLDRDVIEAVAQRLGLAVEASELSRARVWKDLEAGDLDIAVSTVRTPERDLFSWFVPYYVARNVVLLSKRLGFRVTTPDQFRADDQLRWGVVSTYQYGSHEDAWITDLRARGRVEESADLVSLLRKLSQGRIDGAFGLPPLFWGGLSLVVSPSSIAIQDWSEYESTDVRGLALSRKRFSEAEAEVVRRTVLALRDDGTLRTLFGRYLPAADVQQLLRF